MRKNLYSQFVFISIQFLSSPVAQAPIINHELAPDYPATSIPKAVEGIENSLEEHSHARQMQPEFHSQISKQRKLLDTITTNLQNKNGKSRSNSEEIIPVGHPENENLFPEQSSILNEPWNLSMDTQKSKNTPDMVSFNNIHHHLSSPIARDLIRINPLSPNHPGPSVTERIVGLEHVLEEPYHASPAAPVADHVVHTQSEYLKFIEEELMADIDDTGFNELHAHCKFNPTSPWINPTLDIHTIHKPQTLNTDLQSHTSQVRRVLDTIPTKFPNIDDSRANSEESTHVGQVKDKYLGPEQSRILNEPCNSSMSTQNNENPSDLVGSNSSQKSPSISDKDIENYHALSPQQVLGVSEKRLMFYRDCRPPTIISTLKWKGGLGVWHNLEVLKQIDNFFDSIDRNEHLHLQSLSSQCATHKSAINLAIERIRNDVVMGYLGGIVVMLSGHSKIAPMKDLMADGWQFLRKYLHEELYPSHPQLTGKLHKPIEFQNLSEPFNLLGYLLSLRPGKTAVSPTLIETLISHWSEQSNIKPHIHGIQMDTNSFLSIIESTANLLGKSIVKFNRKFQAAPQVPSSKNRLISQYVHDPCPLLQKIGQNELKDQPILLKQIDIFFKILETQMIKHWYKIVGPSTTCPVPKSEMIDPQMIKGMLKTVQNSLVPEVLGTLFLLHQSQEGKYIKESLLASGWEALKAYLSPWESIFVKEPTSILLNLVKKSVEWYDPKSVMHYYCLHTTSHYYYPEPMWFIVEIWYEMVIDQRHNGITELNFVPAAPNRDIYDKIVSYQKNNPWLKSKRITPPEGTQDL